MVRKLAVVLAALTLAGAAYAEGSNVIPIRQAGQDLLLGDFSGIHQVILLKGNVKTIQKPAAAMARWMRQFPTLFPAGSDKGDHTKALPAIWSNMAGFQKDADNFADAADKMAQLAEANDSAGVAKQFKVVAEACNTCHHSFRER